MSAEKVIDRMSVLYEMLKSVETNVNQLRNRIYELEQENEELKKVIKVFELRKYEEEEDIDTSLKFKQVNRK